MIIITEAHNRFVDLYKTLAAMYRKPKFITFEKEQSSKSVGFHTPNHTFIFEVGFDRWQKIVFVVTSGAFETLKQSYNRFYTNVISVVLTCLPDDYEMKWYTDQD